MCIFTVPSVEYLGHIIDKNSLHPSPSKVQAIKQVPQPTNVTELKSFLGLVNYYHKFLPNLSTLDTITCLKWEEYMLVVVIRAFSCI
jgi:hypothetical protein